MSDSCGESIQDDIESLHDLFSEPATGSQSGFSEADGVASAGFLTRSIEDVSPAVLTMTRDLPWKTPPRKFAQTVPLRT